MRSFAIFIVVLSLAFLSFLTPVVAQQSGDKDSDKKHDAPSIEATAARAGKKQQKAQNKAFLKQQKALRKQAKAQQKAARKG